MLKKKIRYYLFGLTICFCHLTLLAQNKNIDSLLTLIKTSKPDTNKVIYLCRLIHEYELTGDYEKGLNNGTEALKLAQQLGFEKGVENAYYNIASTYYFQGDYLKALDCYFTVLALLEQHEQHDRQQTIPDKEYKWNILQSIGAAYFRKGDYSKTIDFYFRALKIADDLGDKNKISSLLSGIGFAYRNQENYTKAMEYDFKALKIEQELGDKKTIAGYLSNIGMIYNMQGDFNNALKYRFKALQIAKEFGDKSLIAESIGNIGVVYSRQTSGAVGAKDSLYDNARDYYFKALNLIEELGNKSKSALWLNIIGNTYQIQSNSEKLQRKKKELLNKAMDYYFKSLKIKEELGNKRDIAIQLNTIGTICIQSGNYAEAEKYLLHALDIEKEIGALEQEMICENNLSELYAKTGQTDHALAHYKKVMQLKDTLFSAENSQKTASIQFTYEQEKKDKIHELEQKAKEQQHKAEIEKQRIISWSVFGALLLVLVFAGFIFRSLHTTRKQKQIIEIKSKEVEKQKKLVEHKNKEITDSINYAKRIQQAKLPKKEEIYAALPQSFILFKPKDIVSGDFYFFHKNEFSVFIASADCTGHGVPGAFMSMIGSEKLEDAVSQTTDTSEILKLLNKGIKISLHQSEINESTRDGMDIALCSIETENRIVKYAGANRPIWIIRKGQTEVEETKATKKAIGGFTEDKQHFDTHELKLHQGDTFYIFTDGYADQFGGEDGKKLMTKKFKEILLNIQDKTMQEQEKHLDTFVDNWRGKREQIDDILVIGVRL